MKKQGDELQTLLAKYAESKREYDRNPALMHSYVEALSALNDYAKINRIDRATMANSMSQAIETGEWQKVSRYVKKTAAGNYDLVLPSNASLAEQDRLLVLAQKMQSGEIKQDSNEMLNFLMKLNSHMEFLKNNSPLIEKHREIKIQIGNLSAELGSFKSALDKSLSSLVKQKASPFNNKPNTVLNEHIHWLQDRMADITNKIINAQTELHSYKELILDVARQTFSAEQAATDHIVDVADVNPTRKTENTHHKVSVIPTTSNEEESFDDIISQAADKPQHGWITGAMARQKTQENSDKNDDVSSPKESGPITPKM